MQLPLQITFRNLPPSDAITASIRKHADKLNRFYDRIMGCRVVVDAPPRHHHKGNLYQVRIDLTVPHKELVVNHESPAHQAYEDIYVAIRDAFAAAQRQLMTYAQCRRHQVKSHATPPYERIVNLFPSEGYGFIKTPEGHEIYFHKNSLLNRRFSELEIGDPVRFALEEGDLGSQASTVRLIGKHHRL
ncbi:MAG: HPF/RaiA family ribosome-associated protein [Leptolyngbya sp. SIO1E4]|nr:HPF/RaiA family ribosome-associated protein [Leptolyngbya sp. SIO1E4]